MMKVIQYCTTTLALVSVMSCSSFNEPLPSYDKLLRDKTGQNGRACIRQSDINGYGILKDDVISINGRGKNHYYLATTLFQCWSLQTSFSAGFKGGFSQFCGGANDKILTSEESCPIKSIFEFESKEAAFSMLEELEKVRANLRNEAKEKAASQNDDDIE